MSSDIKNKGYEYKEVEQKWYDFWQKESLFTADPEKKGESFSIVIPPPNVTGVLHMGHALNIALQDILCRYKRIKGFNVCWIPGTDHAGIATQNVVEKQLAAEGKTRHQVGREEFINSVWKWREKYGGAITRQMKRLGASCDWSKERFTMDEGLYNAVREVFVKLYREKLIYKGNYIINWCPRCHTALSDIEVEHQDIDGKLYYIRYPFLNSKDGLIVATTRPETMLGDTGVAINPKDERYLNLKETEVKLPLTNRNIPVIKDKYVDVSFGTGALKVTPAHDVNDFEIGLRNNLKTIKVIADDGTMTHEAGEFAGIDRFECRKKVVTLLKNKGLLIDIKKHPHSVGHCYRCSTVIEPNLSEQWFVSVKTLAEKAKNAVEQKETLIIPQNWTKTYYEWLNNIKDWCISRQIWWGHRIPAWECEECGHLTVTTKDPEQCEKCGSENILQDTDVLDTWFSSALWPFSTMGWPQETKLVKKYYPTEVLVTAFDILFFWVARMMMMGIHFMGQAPFKKVYVHALVRDEEGKKMSKSKGNVIDPISLIENYGTDAFRYTLAISASQGRDIKMSEKIVDGYRHFINKLWNAARFSFMHIDEKSNIIANEKDFSITDKWILSKLSRLHTDVSDALDAYKFNEAASILYKFVWREFCDWYIEASKPALYGKKGDASQQAAKSVLYKVLKDTLILLHPFIPFITEEIWHKLPASSGSIMNAVYPSHIINGKPFTDDKAEKEVKLCFDIITGIRNVRGEMNIPPGKKLEVEIHTAPDSGLVEIVLANQDLIINLGRLKSLIAKPFDRKPKASAVSVPAEGLLTYVILKGVIEVEKEQARLEKEMAKASKVMTSVTKKLSNDDFLYKAPKHVIEKAKERYEEAKEKYNTLKASLDKITSLNE